MSRRRRNARQTCFSPSSSRLSSVRPVAPAFRLGIIKTGPENLGPQPRSCLIITDRTHVALALAPSPFQATATALRAFPAREPALVLVVIDDNNHRPSPP